MFDDLEGAARLLNTPQSDEISDGGFYTLCLFVAVIKVVSHLCQRIHPHPCILCRCCQSYAALFFSELDNLVQFGDLSRPADLRSTQRAELNAADVGIQEAIPEPIFVCSVRHLANKFAACRVTAMLKCGS